MQIAHPSLHKEERAVRLKRRNFPNEFSPSPYFDSPPYRLSRLGARAHTHSMCASPGAQQSIAARLSGRASMRQNRARSRAKATKHKPIISCTPPPLCSINFSFFVLFATRGEGVQWKTTTWTCPPCCGYCRGKYAKGERRACVKRVAAWWLCASRRLILEDYCGDLIILMLYRALRLHLHTSHFPCAKYTFQWINPLLYIYMNMPIFGFCTNL